MKQKTNFSYATTLVAFATLVTSSYAVDRIKQNNTTALNLSGSWDTLPTSSDVAVFDSTYATVGALNSGALLTWQGVRVTSPGGIVGVGPAGGIIGCWGGGMIGGGVPAGGPDTGGGMNGDGI